MSKLGDEPAFPGFEHTDGYGPAKKNAAGDWEYYQPGMTLRQHYAGLAMQGVILRCSADTIPPGMTTEEYFACKAIDCADALISALEKEAP